MRDRWRVVAGLAVFLALVLFPVLKGAARRYDPPALPKPASAKECLLPRAEMRARHMDLLDEWRETVVRTGKRETRTASGATVRMSLTGTCLSCHESRKEFCDRCHAQLSVEPVCWSCHVTAKEER